MNFIWFYKLFISSVTFTGDYAHVWTKQTSFKNIHGDDIIILDTDYEVDLKFRRLTIYYVPNNWLTRLMGFTPVDCLLKINKCR